MTLQTGGSQTSPQAAVNRHFQTASGYWCDVYTHTDLTARIYQSRQAEVLRLIETLSLPAGSRILEAGCGAGRTTLELAKKNYRVHAVDSVESMTRTARYLASEAGVSQRVETSVADVTRLPFPDATFAVAIAVGVTPWLPSVSDGLRELARVMEPGGHLVITADNRIALTRLLDPLARISQAGGAMLSLLKLRARGPIVHTYSPARFDALLRGAGFEPRSAVTIGFGPLCIAKREVLSCELSLRLNLALQSCASRGVPVARSLGRQYVVLARGRGQRQ